MQEILFSVITGAIGSFLVAFFLFRLRPKIAISESIAKELDAAGRLRYSFKIINKTPYPLYDIQIKLCLITPFNISNGTIKHNEVIMAFDNFELESCKNPSEPYENELIVGFTSDLESIWNDSNQKICLYVFSKHSFSQFSKVEKQIYYKKSSSIKVGHFPNGRLDIVT